MKNNTNTSNWEMSFLKFYPLFRKAVKPSFAWIHFCVFLILALICLHIYSTLAVIISTWSIQHSPLQFEQGDVGSVGFQHQFLQSPLLFGRLVASLRVDPQEDPVGRRPLGPAAQSTFVKHLLATSVHALIFSWFLWPLQTVCSGQDPLGVDQSSSTEMNSHAVGQRHNKHSWQNDPDILETLQM